MDELERLRAQIDRTDAQILALVHERARRVAEVWRWKQAHGLPLTDPGREAALLERLRTLNEGSGLDPQVVEALFRTLLRARIDP